MRTNAPIVVRALAIFREVINHDPKVAERSGLGQGVSIELDIGLDCRDYFTLSSVELEAHQQAVFGQVVQCAL